MAKRPKSDRFNTNNAAITALREQRRTAQDTEIELRRQGKDAEAEQVWARAQVLTAKIDVLIGRLMEDWGAETAALTADLVAAQATIDAAIEKIKKNMEVAKQVTAILGGLDEAIAIAAKFMI